MKKSRRNNKTRVAIAILKFSARTAAIAIALALFITALFPSVKAAESMDDVVGYVRYEYVNLREKPSTTSEILDVLYNGTTVTYTGNYIEYLLHDVYSYWVEVEVGNQIGWVVRESVKGFCPN